jgi:hypothetical protein
VLLPDNEHMAMNSMVEANLTCSAAPNDVIQVVAIDEQGSALDGVLVSPTVVNSILRERSLHGHEPVIFKQMFKQWPSSADFHAAHQIMAGGSHVGSEAGE